MTPTTPAQPRRRDRRRDRHEATKREILDTAWSMVRADGLAALSLRALAHAVDMEPQSLYTYFASKNALYDHMFADGNQELARRFAAAEIPDELRAALRAVARLFVEFAAEDQARYQLLFLRTIPGFQPSPESYATAVEILASGRVILTRAGLRDDADFDLWTALVAGLASQQLANDPGGDRYTRLIDDAVAMFADHVLGGRQPSQEVVRPDHGAPHVGDC
jgi:AcrR family transcriptional regulator